MARPILGADWTLNFKIDPSMAYHRKIKIPGAILGAYIEQKKM